jgi:hypothetical protein
MTDNANEAWFTFRINPIERVRKLMYQSRQ